jgi:WD40 repeat protein
MKSLLIALVLVCTCFGAVQANGQERAAILPQLGHSQPTTSAVALFPQLGHSNFINAIALSPDGRLLASGGVDNTIEIWDLAANRELRVIGGYKAPVDSLAFSPDGLVLAAGSDDGSMRLWEVSTGTDLSGIGPQDVASNSVAFSANGAVLAVGRSDGSVAVMRLRRQDALKLQGQQGAIHAVAVAPDGSLVASAGEDGTVSLWDTSSGKLVRTLKAHSSKALCVSFSPDGRLIASAGDDGQVKLWDAASGQAMRSLALGGKTPLLGPSIHALAFSPDGRRVASGAADATVTIWDIASGEKRLTLSVAGNRGFMNAIAFSNDGKLIFAGGDDDRVDVWDATTGHAVRVLDGQSRPAPAVAYSSDGSAIATGYESGKIDIWNAATSERLRRLDGSSSINSVAFSPSGKILAAADTDGDVVLWDLATGHEIRRLSGQPTPVYSLAFSPDGSVLASGGFDYSVRLWDVSSGKQLQRLKHDGPVDSVAFSPDGAMLVSGGWDQTVRIWDVATGRQLRVLGKQAQLTLAGPQVALSRDGKLLAVGTLDGAIEVFDPHSGSKTKTFRGEGPFVVGLAFSPDGRVLAAGFLDNTIELWDTRTGKLLRTLTGHSGFIGAVAFSPDGRVLASSSADGTTRQWDAASGRPLVERAGFNDGSWVAVTPEGFFDSSSAKAEGNLNVRIGQRVFGISSFRDTFYRPDLVRRSLAGEDISRFGDIANVKLSPVVELVNTPASTADPNLEITVKLSEGGGGIGSVRVFKQGTVILQDDSQGQLTRRYTIPLSSGDNAVRVAAANADGSMWSMVDGTVTSTLPAANDNAPRGTLHAIVIGINTYPVSLADNLRLAVPDANLFAGTLAAKAAPLFKSLDIQRLTTPQQTDRASIENAIRAMQKTVGPDDAFVFYVASHGVVDGDEYYLLTSNVGALTHKELQEGALSRRELTDLLANIATTHKIVFIDTCDSRGLTGEGLQAVSLAGMDPKTAATIIGRQVGMTMLMAADTDQEALAGYPPTAPANDQHGLFTFALNQGLEGEAADPASGLVASDKLADYVNKTVPAIAKSLNRAQQPTDVPAGQPFPITSVK